MAVLISHCSTSVENYYACIKHKAAGFKTLNALAGDLVYLAVSNGKKSFCGTRFLLGKQIEKGPWQDGYVYKKIFQIEKIEFCKPFPLSVILGKESGWGATYLDHAVPIYKEGHVQSLDRVFNRNKQDYFDSIPGTVFPINKKDASETKSGENVDLFNQLGSLVYRCQRIEWILKYLVDKAFFKKEFNNINDVKAYMPNKDKWLDDAGTLGALKNRYLELFNDGVKESSFSEGKIGVQFNILFDDSKKKIRMEVLDKLVEERNYLSHRFGLDFNLDDKSCHVVARNRLLQAEEIISKAEIALREDYTLFNRLVSSLNPTEMAKMLRQLLNSSPKRKSLDEVMGDCGFIPIYAKTMKECLNSFKNKGWIASSIVASFMKKKHDDFSYKTTTCKKQSDFLKKLEESGVLKTKKEGDVEFFQMS